MIRRLIVLGVILAFVVSLKDHAGYCVIINLACPPQMRPAVSECVRPSPDCSERPEAIQSKSCCTETEEPACAPANSSCGKDASAPCGKPPCPNSKSQARCCLCVPPFWSDPPIKLTITISQESAPLFARATVAEIDEQIIARDKYIIPPWGVHPSISTSVLRI